MMKRPTARRLAWGLFAVTMALAAGAIVFLVLGIRTPPPAGSFGVRGFAGLFAFTFGVPGALIAARHPRNPIGWVFLGLALGSAFQELANQYAIWAIVQEGGGYPLEQVAAWIPAWFWIPVTSGAMFLLLLFPDGHLPSPRWRWVAVVGSAGAVAGATGFALHPGPLENFRVVDNPFGIGPPDVILAVGFIGETIYGLGIISSAVALARRFRRSSGEERRQLTWLVAAGLFLSLSLAGSFVGQILIGPAPGTEVPGLVALVVILGFTSLPVATAIAMFRHRLFDIELVVNRAVVYAALAAFITATYVAIVIGIGTVVGSGGNAFLSAVAAAIVALAFQPARRWAQRLANRVVYGERATPYEVLSGFSGRLAETYSVDDVLPRMARVLGEGVGAARVAIFLGTGPSRSPVAAWPQDRAVAGPDARTFEVRHQGQPLGEIEVAMHPGSPLDATQEKLVADVAAQAGLVLRNAALIDDLRASRQRLVAAQDQERRRIERNIHDGAQQQLVALAVKLRIADTLVGTDEDRAHATLAELGAETNRALEDLRDLARGIYPPLLADEGLPAALESQGRRSPVAVRVEASGIGRYPQEIEAAVYFSCLEALQNVSKYADANGAVIRLAQSDGTLRFEVADDGRGFDPEAAERGSGLQGIADRLAALGGTLEVRSALGEGTMVTGRLPVGSSA